MKDEKIRSYEELEPISNTYLDSVLIKLTTGCIDEQIIKKVKNI